MYAAAFMLEMCFIYLHDKVLVVLLALQLSYDCHSASKVMVKNKGKNWLA